jgi:hypothetical protein
MNNMELWKKVEKTQKDLIGQVITDDGKALKTVPSINRVKKATEMFGIYGKNWGLKEIKHTELRANNGLLLGILDAIFFVNAENCETEFQITNSTPITIMVGKIFNVNATYRKAIETDTINKALSKLGFNADIYSDDELVKTEAEVDDSFASMDLIDI